MPRDTISTTSRSAARCTRSAKAGAGPFHRSISEQIERWNGPAPAFADRVQRAAERDVVDIVSRGMRERPGLAPARHAPVHQPRIAAQRYIGTELEALHHAG